MDLQVSAAIIGAIIGAISAFILSYVLEWKKNSERKENVAIALVYELRIFERNIRVNLNAAEQRYIIFTSGLSDEFYRIILTELPSYGPKIFLYVRTTYNQIKQINYLRTECERAAKGEKSIQSIPNLGESYTASLKEALANIEISLDELKNVVSKEHFSLDLPEIRFLTDMEKTLTKGIS